MFRHNREKKLLDLALRDVDLHASDLLVWELEHAPSALTLIVDNSTDQDVTIQVVGGRVPVATLLQKANVGSSVVVGAGAVAHIGVFPYMKETSYYGQAFRPAYAVEVTVVGGVSPTEGDVEIWAEYLIDQ